MNYRAYRLLLPYVVAIASTAIALLLTLWLKPFMTLTSSGFFLLAIILNTWYGGILSGIVSVVLSVLAINYFLIAPVQQIFLADPDYLVRLGIFTIIALIINLLCAKLKASKYKVEQLSRKLQAESAQRLKTALNAAQMGMWDWDIETGNLSWSPEHEILFGLAPGSFDGRYETFDTCLHPEDREGLNQAIAKSLKNRLSYQHEYRVVWADGSIHWLEARGKAFYNKQGQPLRMSGTVMAIDSRKQTETALQEGKALLRLFAQYAPAGIAMFDREMRYVMASQRWADEYNLGSLESLIGRSHYEIFPEISEKWRQIHQRCLAGAIKKCDEDLFIRTDGTQQWISWEIHPWHTTTGEIGGIIVFSVDITKRKQAELALQQLNAELEQRVAERTIELGDLYNNAPCGYHSLDVDGFIIRINDTELNWLGYPREELLNKKKFIDLLTHESRKKFYLDLNKFQQQGWINNLEFEMVNKDGTTRWVNVNASAIKDSAGNCILSRSTLFDITDRKRIEKALLQSEETFRLISEFSPIGIFLSEITGQLVYSNPLYQKIIGASAEDALGDGWEEFIHPEDREWVFKYWSELVATGREGVFNDLRYQDRQGKVCYTQVRTAPVKTSDGKIILFVGIVEDITERRKIDQMKKDFISVVSHELRTPLTSIRGSLGLVAGGVYDKKPQKIKEMIAIAARQSDRLVRLVNDILDLRRLESGQTQFNFQLCAATDLIQQSVDVMRAQAEQNHITLSIIPSEIKVWADSDAIVQTITNLLSNAIKFSPENSTITISAKVIHNHFLTQKQISSFVLLSVQDQGRGIPEDKLETIFEQFQQVDASDSREKGGTGLGLAICRNIVEQHGGKIWVESVLNQGSTFYFTLPLNDANC